MTNTIREVFNARNIKKVDLERADKVIREGNYNYEVDLSTLYQLRSLITDEVRNAQDKKKAFQQSMERHDDRVIKRPGDSYPIHIGGQPIYIYLAVLRKVKSLGGTEFDEYWSDDRA